MRLNKFIAQSGYCSRRHADRLIEEGKVEINGKLQKELGVLIDPDHDEIKVDGQTLSKPEKFLYVMMNKPKGYVTTKSDPHAEHTIFSLLPDALQNLHPVGRLDKNTEGLLILTNDGNFTYSMTHPGQNCEKVYSARLKKCPLKQEIQRLERGIFIEEEVNGKKSFYKTQPCRIEVFPETKKVVIHLKEGRKRQIRKMFQKIGHPVLYLKRLKMGPYELGELKTGEWCEIAPAQ